MSAGRKRKPPARPEPREPPVEVKTELKEVEDTAGAADLMRRILRAQAVERERRKQKEQKHDAA